MAKGRAYSRLSGAALSGAAVWSFFFCALLLFVCQRLGYEPLPAYNPRAAAATAAAGFLTTAATVTNQVPLTKPATYGGVYHYRIPGAFDPVEPTQEQHPVAGTLHVFLKAARFPDGHLRAKGFVMFEFASVPSIWDNPKTKGVAVKNVPEVYRRLRMSVACPSRKWEREFALVTNFDDCERQSSKRGFNYTECVAQARNQTDDAFNFPDISLDFGNIVLAPKDIELAVIGWPRRVSLEAQLQAAVAAGDPPPHDAPDSTSPPQLVYALPPNRRVDPALPHLRHMSADKTAQLLAWAAQYHEPLGFKSIVLYLLPEHAEPLAAHPTVQQMVADGRVTLVVWDEFSWLEGWYAFDHRVVQTHTVLSFWGRNARVLLADWDEFLVPGSAHTPLPTMLGSGGCLAALERAECFYFKRRNIFPTNGQGGEARGVEQAAWEPFAAAGDAHPLQRYHYSAPQDFPKPLVDPNFVMPISIHWTSICTGQSLIANGNKKRKLYSACSAFTHCTWVPQECGWIAHVSNMQRDREVPLNAQPIEPADWLWMLSDS